MNQQRKLSRHDSRQSSIGETASVGSSKSAKSAASSADFTLATTNTTSSFLNNHHSSACTFNSNNNTVNKAKSTSSSASSSSSSRNNLISRQGSQDSGTSGQYSCPTTNNNNNNNYLTSAATGNSVSQQQSTTNSNANSILNVAEMLLHGLADNEIFDIWLRSIQCEEFVCKFIEAGYDMPTISRITPQDLTAIGVTDPAKRLKILTEIKKLNLHDGLPNFKPQTLNHWLKLIRLDSYYYNSLCEQKIDTIEKMCQLTWEDFEELGITKLGHQKRFQLAIERVKEMDSAQTKNNTKPISEPIYDTNPSQILLVASSENHSMNGPIINKQSSTSEFSSTGSGSMNSVYSSTSTQYQQQPTYAATTTHDKAAPQHVTGSTNITTNNSGNLTQSSQQQQQAIYNQLPNSSQMNVYQQLSHHHITTATPTQQQMQQQQQQSHYMPIQPMQQNSSSYNGPEVNYFIEGSHHQIAGGLMSSGHQPQNRQSMSQLMFGNLTKVPLGALAKLPRHQQQMLQQSSIYATLSRQPSTKPKQPPPPVPIRTNSLKPNSQPPSASTTTMLTKNKSFSGNAYMEASRARFLNRNSQHQQQINMINGFQHPPQSVMESGSIYNTTDNLFLQRLSNGNNEQIPLDHTLQQHSSSHHPMSIINSGHRDVMVSQQQQQQSHYSPSNIQQSRQQIPYHHIDDFDQNSDTQSTKSLIATSSPVDSNNPPSQESGSSQTLYNSASSGSNDPSLNIYNSPQATASVEKLLKSGVTTASSCTLNDANHLTLEHQHQGEKPKSDSRHLTSNLSEYLPNGGNNSSNHHHYNATTGKDDDFPPPPSPLSLTDFVEDHVNPTNNNNHHHHHHQLYQQQQQQQQQFVPSINGSSESNFTDAHHGLVTFRVG